MSLRVCVLGSGSKGNSTLVATEKTRVLVRRRPESPRNLRAPCCRGRAYGRV